MASSQCFSSGKMVTPAVIGTLGYEKTGTTADDIISHDGFAEFACMSSAVYPVKLTVHNSNKKQSNSQEDSSTWNLGKCQNVSAPERTSGKWKGG